MTKRDHARVLHRGTFDVDNFGDLLFPHIVRHRLAALDVEIEHQSPTGAATRYSDAIPTRRIGSDSAAAAVIVGGGNLIKTGRGALATYERRRLTDPYAALWSSDSDNPARIWMAVGVPRVPDAETTARLRSTPQPAYASVRDEHSLEWLAQTGLTAVLRPDSAFSIAEVWPDRRSLSRDGNGHPPYVTVSLKARDLGVGPAVVARSIRSFAALLDARIVLVPLGHCHGDEIVAKEILARLPISDAVMASTRSLRAVCALLAGAVAHIGSSLHGGVVSASYGVPVVWISRTPEQGLPKLLGALRWMPPSTLLLRSWSDLVDSLVELHPSERTQARFETVAGLRRDAEALRSILTIGREAPVTPFAGALQLSKLQTGGLPRDHWPYKR